MPSKYLPPGTGQMQHLSWSLCALLTLMDLPEACWQVRSLPRAGKERKLDFTTGQVYVFPASLLKQRAKGVNCSLSFPSPPHTHRLKEIKN